LGKQTWTTGGCALGTMQAPAAPPTHARIPTGSTCGWASILY